MSITLRKVNIDDAEWKWYIKDKDIIIFSPEKVRTRVSIKDFHQRQPSNINIDTSVKNEAITPGKLVYYIKTFIMDYVPVNIYEGLNETEKLEKAREYWDYPLIFALEKK